jgi:hypothetical protein
MIGCALVTDLSDLGGTSSDAHSPDAPASDAAGLCRGTYGAAGVVIDGKYCIDSTEITVDDFQAFLTSAKGNFSPYLPDSGWCDTQNVVPKTWGQQPNPFDGGASLGSTAAGNLNYCSAVAYCAWAGKRLCGAIGTGGVLDAAAMNNASASEWFNVCSHGDDKLHTWAYGVSFDASVCAPAGGTTAFPVGTYPDCVGGYPGVFDMSGNVAEWTNECTLELGGDCTVAPCCAMRAASINYPISDYSQCTFAFKFQLAAEGTYAFGARCCSDLAN